MKQDYLAPPFKGPSYFQLYRYATLSEILLMLAGSLAAIVNGASIPLLAYLTGVSTDAYNQPDPLKAVKPSILAFVGVGFFTLILSFTQVACWTISGQRQAMTMRSKFVQAMFQQQAAWFDRPNILKHSSLLSTQITTIQKAISDSVPGFIMMISTVFVSFLLAFLSGWKLALLGCLAIPIIALAGHMFGKVIRQSESKNRKIYGQCASKTQQILSSIQTVKANVAQQFQLNNFIKKATQFKQTAVKAGWKAAFAVAFFISTIPITSSLVFWYGSKLIQQGAFNSSTGKLYEAGNVFSVFFTIFVSGMNLGQIFPSLKAFTLGAQAGVSIFSVIDKKKPTRKELLKFNPKGHILFQKVNFGYNDQSVLNQLSLQILPGKRNVVVGPTGSGKSTIVQLILKLYSCASGSIKIDGRNIENIDTATLRQSIGYVNQESSIFSGTVRSNLLFANPQASETDIRRALKMAEAQQFVENLPQKLETYLGPSGCSLSGGQKQRLAIARVLLRKPKILLLDQATSALDNINQQLIQKTFDQLGQITTLIVAHRFKTIVNCDRINIIKEGRCVDSGTYQELYQRNQWFKSTADRQLTYNQQQPIEDLEQLQQFDEIADEGRSVRLRSDTQEGQSLLNKPQQLGKLQLFRKLFSFNPQDRLLTGLSFGIALLNGTLLPFFSLFLAHIIAVLLYENGKNSSPIYGFIVVGVLMFSCNYFQYGLFNQLSQKLGLKIRQKILGVLLNKPYTFFSKEQNEVGKLTKLVYEDVNHINKFTSTFIGLNIQNISSLAIGLIISLSNCWQLTFVCLALLPMLAGSALIQLKGINKINQSLELHYNNSASWLSQTILLSKMIKAFNRQKFVKQKYEGYLVEPRKASLKKGLLFGLFFGISQFVFFIIFALVFLMGALFLTTRVVPHDQQGVRRMFTALLALLFSSTPIGYYAQFMPDISAGQRSSSKVLKLLESQQQCTKGQDFPTQIQRLEIEDLSFIYQHRKRSALRNINLRLKKHQKRALVGSSGCGKSTLMLILLKLYQSDGGSIKVNGTNINEIGSKKLRQAVALVPQQTHLFDASLQQNICYNRNFDQHLYNLLKQKLVIDFCSDQTSLGVRGSLLSGGQRQRIALARALYRNPKMLLLDQSTSALDSSTQERVLKGVMQMSEERTVMSIVHRLSTVKSADLISVMQKGEIVEQGTFQELLQKQGSFRKLWDGKKI